MEESPEFFFNNYFREIDKDDLTNLIVVDERLIDYDRIIPFSLGVILTYLYKERVAIKIKDNYYIGVRKACNRGRPCDIRIFVTDDHGVEYKYYIIIKGEEFNYSYHYPDVLYDEEIGVILESKFKLADSIPPEVKAEIESKFDPKYIDKIFIAKKVYIAKFSEETLDIFHEFKLSHFPIPKLDHTNESATLNIYCDFNEYSDLGEFYFNLRSRINSVRIKLEPDIDFGDHFFHMYDLHYDVHAVNLEVHLNITVEFELYDLEEYLKPDGMGYYKNLIDNICDRGYDRNDLLPLIQYFELEDVPENEICSALRFFYKTMTRKDLESILS